MTPLVPYGALCGTPNTVRTKSGADLFYRDWGTGKPVLFVASWALPSDSWNIQMMALLEAGYRVIAAPREDARQDYVLEKPLTPSAPRAR